MSYDSVLPGRAARNLAAARDEPGTQPPPPSEQRGADEVAARTLAELKGALVNVTGGLEDALALEAETVADLREVLDRLEALYRLELSRKLPPTAPALGWRLALSAVFSSLLTTLLLLGVVSLSR